MQFVCLVSLSVLLVRPIMLLCCEFFAFSEALSLGLCSSLHPPPSSFELIQISIGQVILLIDVLLQASVFFWENLISWKSKKQKEVALSTTEAEYIAMSATAREVVWLRQLLPDLGVAVTGSTPLYGDNRSAILIAGNPIFHEWMKHFEVALHFVRSHYLAGTLSLPHLTSVEQTADFFTKAHTVSRFQYLLAKLRFRIHREFEGAC